MMSSSPTTLFAVCLLQHSYPITIFQDHALILQSLVADGLIPTSRQNTQDTGDLRENDPPGCTGRPRCLLHAAHFSQVDLIILSLGAEQLALDWSRSSQLMLAFA
ncbi:hypothetical protein BDR03DRAFT_662809 [Suillus americanus]|nr:hypothetical protein BDR03DRAFT_662809 [Suillus americanus]